MLPPGGIAVLQSYKLRTTWWLTTRHVDEEEKPLEELISFLIARIYCLLLPSKL